MINQQSNTSTYRKFIQKYIYSPLHKYIQHIEGDLKMEFLNRTITKLSFKLTFRKTCWMTHDAEQHNGYNIADLTDTVLLHWSPSNTSAGSQDYEQFKANDRNK